MGAAKLEIDLNKKNEVYTVLEFCKVHRISRSTFTRLLKSGKAPKVIKLQSRMLISKEAAAEWRKNMEK